VLPPAEASSSSSIEVSFYGRGGGELNKQMVATLLDCLMAIGDWSGFTTGPWVSILPLGHEEALTHGPVVKPFQWPYGMDLPTEVLATDVWQQQQLGFHELSSALPRLASSFGMVTVGLRRRSYRPNHLWRRC
jgi:hypothetical protein